MGSFACPNKTSKEWKMLVDQVGEDLANITFVKNGYRMPDVKSITEIKKAIGWQSHTENYAGIARRIKKYNEQNGTSHRFHPVLAYGNTWKLNFIPNYLPVNEEKRRKRLAESYPEFRVSGEELRKDPLSYDYTPSESEQTAGFFNEEGDFLPNADKNLYDDIDDMLVVDSIFDEFPELSKIGTTKQYSQYLDSIFPDSKVKDIVYHSTPHYGFEKFSRINLGTSDRAGIAGFDFLRSAKATHRYLKGEFIKGNKSGTYAVILNIKNPQSYQQASLEKSKAIKIINNLLSNNIISEEVYKTLEDYINTPQYGTDKVYAGTLLSKLFDKVRNTSNLEQAEKAIIEYNNLTKIDSYFQGKNPLEQDRTKITVFEPEQIHILGSKQDIEGFKKFIRTVEKRDDIDDSIAADALRQVDEARRMVPEEIQQKSQILTGFQINKDGIKKRTLKEAVEGNLKSVTLVPNRTDLEVVSIYLFNKRYRLLEQEDQYKVKQWAENWLHDTFSNINSTNPAFEEFIQDRLEMVLALKQDFNLTIFQKEILEDTIDIILDNPNLNYMGFPAYDVHDSLIKKIVSELSYNYNISERYKNYSLEDIQIEIGNTLTNLGEATTEFNKILKNLSELVNERFKDIKRDEFIVDFFKGDIFEAAEKARRKGLIHIQTDLNDDVDFIIESAPQQIAAVENIHAKKIYGEIRELKHKMDRAESIGDIEEIHQLHQQIEEKSLQLADVTIREEFAGTIKAYEQITEQGTTQLDEIEEMLTRPSVRLNDIYYAERVIDLWMAAGDFSIEPHNHIILDEMEFNTPEIQQEFYKLKQRAEALKRKVNEIRDPFILDFVRKQTNEELTEDEIFGEIKDISYLVAQTLNTGRVSDHMVQAIYKAIERQNTKAQQEASDIWKKIDDLTTKFFKKAGNNFEILKQKTKDGLETGRLVTRFSHEFFTERKKKVEEAFYSRDEKTKKFAKNAKKIKEFFDWTNANTITFDPRFLFPDENVEDFEIPDKFIFKNDYKIKQKDKDKHIADLKRQLGEKGYEFYLQRTEKAIKDFQIKRTSIFEKIQSQEGLTQEQKDAKFEEWLRENSPYWATAMAENPKHRQKANGSYYKSSVEFTEQVPRRYLVNGQETEWYDKNYERIEADEDLLNYHNYVIETLNKLRYYLPAKEAKVLGHGVLPTIQRSIMDEWGEKGFRMGAAPFMDKLKQLASTTDLATEVSSDINPLTGEIAKDINISFIEDAEATVNERLKIAAIKHKRDNGRAFTPEERRAMKEKIRHELSQEKSWDVTRILKAHTLSVLSYKHKSFIEPTIRLAISKFQEREEVQLTKTGRTKTKDGKEVTVKGLERLNKSLEYFMDNNFYNIGGRKVEGVNKKKVYTKAEKARKIEIEDLLETVENEQDREILQEEYDKLGSFITRSGVGDAALKYMTLKGLGWNVFSAFSNIGFGWISNIIQASDGREYSMKDIRKAIALVTNSMGRNITFNNWDGRGQVAKKIRNMMDQWDLLQTVNKELFDMTNKSSMSKLKRFGPYALQERSEYLNYAPVMIAIMMNFKATDPDGNTVNLWEAYDVDGKIKEGYTANDVNNKAFSEADMILKIKRVIEMNHGDYNNPLLAKSILAGRALLQFRTWMLEGFANRFESVKVDHILSYGMDKPYRRKGRYLSYSKGQLIASGSAIGTMFLPGVGTLVGGGLGYVGSLFSKVDSGTNTVADTLFALKQLARKLMWAGGIIKKDESGFVTQYHEKFNEVDAANMRKNATELYIMLSLMALALVLKGISDADDDEEDEFILNFLLNQTNRLQTDILFYTNPVEFEKLTKTALPLAGLVQDATTVMSDIAAFFNDDHKDEVFRSGPFKGSNKALIHTGEMVPFAAPVLRLYRTGSRVF